MKNGKASVKTIINKRSGGSVLQIFIRSTFTKNLKYNVKRAFVFHLILFGILSITVPSWYCPLTNWGVCLMDKICYTWWKLFVDRPLAIYIHHIYTFRHLPKPLLRTIYYSLFNTHLFNSQAYLAKLGDIQKQNFFIKSKNFKIRLYTL